MSWRKLAPHIYTAVKVAAAGVTITLGSTVISCASALQIESASHRTLFRFFPHWYANVEHAYGIPDALLSSVRTEARNEKQDAERIALYLQNQQQIMVKGEGAPEMEEDLPTSFTIESLILGPARKQLHEISEMSFANDISACAMTA